MIRIVGFTLILAVVFRYLQLYSINVGGLIPLATIGLAPGFSESEIGDLTGKKYIITGANSGLGKATTLLLAKHGATVYMGCRSMNKCELAADDISMIAQNGKLIPKLIDLASLKSVRKFTTNLKIDKLDGLILNAGFMANTYSETPEGVETMFMVNHLGHFELVQLLEDKIVESGSKIVVISSNTHIYSHHVPTSLEMVNDQNVFDAFKTYGMTKLCNLLFAKELDNRFYEMGVTVNSVHPGLVHTSFLDNANQDVNSFYKYGLKILNWVQHYVAWTPDQGAITIVYPLIKPKSHAQYIVPIAREMEPSSVAKDDDLARKLWIFSEKLVEQLS